MAELDYASNDMVIFHGSFGLFVYDLNKLSIIRALDLKSINCAFTQGDEYCEVQVSKNGNTVQLHPMNSEQMYTYLVSDNILCETNYRHMENSFGSQLVAVEKVINKPQANFSYNAVEFDSGEYGYLTTYDFTLGTLNYVRDDMVYSLFRCVK